MSDRFDVKKLRRMIIIQRFVQVFLMALLVIVALQFQKQLAPPQFLRSVLISLALQLFLFYPIYKLAGKEAEREVSVTASGLSKEEAAELRRKRLFADILKGAFFIFFITFITLAPGTPAAQSIIFFTFILTTLTYFQCINFAVKRGMQQKN